MRGICALGPGTGRGRRRVCARPGKPARCQPADRRPRPRLKSWRGAPMDTIAPDKESAGAVRASPAAPKGPDILRTLATFVIATAAGAVANQLNMPLPWMLGPLFVCAGLSLAGFRLS